MAINSIANIVPNSTVLAALTVPPGISPGTRVYNLDVGSDFVYTVTDDALVPDEVVQVSGIDGARWVRDFGGEGAPWLVNAEIFVSPEGDDENDGTGWQSAKETIYAGIQALGELTIGGGRVNIADGSSVGGPVASQGIRLRADVLPTGMGFFFDSPGFQQFGPIELVGFGGASLNFAPGVGCRIVGGGSGPFNPMIWVVGSGSMNPVRIRNIQGSSTKSFGIRVGVDYDRKLDGTVQEIAISSAARTGTTTTYTVTLPTVGLSVSAAERTSNVVTLTIPNPGLPWPPFRVGVPFRLASNDEANFPSGDYVITDQNNPLTNRNTWTISYSNSGSDVSPTALTGTVKTHGCKAGELIDVESTNVHFQSAQYMVDSVTATTVVVTDVFGDGNRTATPNIGFLAHQERFICGTTGVVFDRAGVQIENGSVSYHSFDIGHNAAISTIIQNGTWYEGYVGDGSGPRDERMMSAIYAYPGTHSYGPPAIGVKVYDSFGTNGSIYIEAGQDIAGTCRIDARRCVHETNHIELELPVLHVEGNGFTSVLAQDLENADSDPFVATVNLHGVQASAARIDRSGFVKGACVGGDNWQVPGAWGTSSIIPTPWEGFGQGFTGMHVTSWADGRITGKHPGVARAMGGLGARFKNIVVDPASWFLRGQTLDLNQPAPDGSSTGVLLHSTNGYVSVFPSATDGNTWAEGGRFFVGGWFNFEDNETSISNEGFRVLTATVTFNESSTGSIPCPFAGAGWQYISGFLTVASVSDSTPNIEVEVRCQSGKTMGLWGITAFYIPDTVPAADAFELLGTQRHQPRYLLPGMAGTMESQIFVAHGGLGTNNAYVEGAGAGQLTIVGSFSPKRYEPVYTAAGVIKGWVELINATINP